MYRVSACSKRKSASPIRNGLTDSSPGTQHGVLPQHDPARVATHSVCSIQSVDTHTQYVNCDELWLVTEGGVVCVSALGSGEFQGPKCV